MVTAFARDLQVQERLTRQIADWLEVHLGPKGVGVVLEAEHLCMALRGVQARGLRKVTSALHGSCGRTLDPVPSSSHSPESRGDPAPAPQRSQPRRPPSPGDPHD